MSHAITRIYGTAENAANAVKRLKFYGFSDDVITQVAPPAGSGASTEKIMAAIMTGYVLKAEAKIYAQEVQSGRWLVSIRPSFGMGITATRALDSTGPVASQVQSSDDRASLWDEATPLSCAFGMPVLIPARLDNSLGIPTTLSNPNGLLSRLLRLPLLTNSSSARLSPELAHFSLSSKSGLPMLTGSGRRR